MPAPLANRGPDRTSSGGAGGGWRAFVRLTTPALCWEFLRRNPAYRSDFDRVETMGTHLDRRWGLAAPANPDLSADDGRVIWREDVAPGLVVPVERASFGEARALPRSRSDIHQGEDGRHIRLPSGLQVLLRGDAPAGGPLMVVMAYDADFNLRVRAVDALRRASLTDAPPNSRLSTTQKERLARCLYALDATLKDRTHREIARELFGPDEIEGPDFATSTIRDVTARLVRRGRALMSGGYLRLLRAGF
jgi:hypothetical protein